jgi:hypothetical protein
MTRGSSITVSGLRAQRQSSGVVVMRFLKLLQRKPQTEYLWVFEGQDIKYYGARIEQFTGRPARYTFPADGRENTLECMRRLNTDPALRGQRVAFFVDRDVVAPTPTENLYITPTYSIENFYVSHTAFERVLLNLFGLGEAERSKERESLISLYGRWAKIFSTRLSDLMAWIYIQQTDFGQTSKQLNLKNASFSKLFEMNLSGKKLTLKSKFGVRNARRLFPNAPVVTAAALKSKKTLLANIDWLSYGRGKYWADFYCKIVSELAKDCNSSNPSIFRRKHKVSLTIGASNLLEVFTSHADTPTCLRNFLSSRTAQ